MIFKGGGGWFYKKIYTPGGITKYIYLVNERMDERWLCPTSLALGIILIWKSLRSWNIKGTVIYFKGEIIGIKPSNCRNKLWNASQRSEIKYIFLNQVRQISAQKIPGNKFNLYSKYSRAGSGSGFFSRRIRIHIKMK